MKVCNKEKISIIVPVYNVEKYLGNCLDSIINQTYENLEVILVDDGSPDSCGEICDKYAKRDSRIKVIHKQNGGLSDARNCGLKIATGEIICFVDSDDYIASKFCEVMLNTMNKNNCDIVECGSIQFFDKDVPIVNYTNEEQVFSPKEWLTESELGEMITCVVWNKLYRRSVVRDIEFPLGKRFEDEATTYKFVYRANKIVRLSSKMYFYRQRDESITHQIISLNDIKDKCTALKDKYSFFERKNETDIAAFAKAKYCIMLVHMYSHLAKSNVKRQILKNTKNEIKKLFKEFRHNDTVPKKYKIYIFAFIIVPLAFKYI